MDDIRAMIDEYECEGCYIRIGDIGACVRRAKENRPGNSKIACSLFQLFFFSLWEERTFAIWPFKGFSFSAVRRVSGNNEA